MKMYHRFKLLLLVAASLLCSSFTYPSFSWKLLNAALRQMPVEKEKKAALDWRVPPVMCVPQKASVRAVPTGFLAMALPWSDPATWGGTLPAAGDNVTIPAGTHILLDTNTPPLAGLTIEGILEFDQQDLDLTADWIMVMGEMHIGSEATPFAHQATITLTDDNPNASQMGMGTRGIMVMGGLLEMHGTPPAIPWTKINAHAPAGSTSLSLVESVNWSTGDQVVIAPTDFYEAGFGASVTQRLGLTAVSGTSLTLGGALNAHRWGLLQYATTAGMSLTNNDPVTPPAPSGFTPTILDERAEVGNLTRNIVIQAPDDALWQTQGFGCHVMVMREGMVQGVAHVNGVEIRRGGQRGLLGRYPFHWHMLSYDGTQTLADATGQYFRNSSVNESANRGIVIHGTNGVEVSDNVVFNVRGHGVFFEDAAERRNLVDGNLVLLVRNAIVPLKQHETGERGASGFWISNPDNTITNNTAADCGTNGIWLAFPAHPWGLSIDVPINPSRTQFGVFDGNTAHSNRLEGILLDWVEVDNSGTVSPFQYMSTTDGQNPQWPWNTLQRFALERFVTWKNGFHGLWDRGVWPDNYEGISADNCGRFFAGSGAEGMIERCLVVGTSLNHLMNGTDRPNFTGEFTPAAFATYHSAFDIRHNIVVNFPAVDNTSSGAFATNDYYIRPVDKGQVRNVDNLAIASHTGVKLTASFPHFTFAGALWDPHDNWGGDPAEDNFYVYDTPFFTYGQTPTAVQPSAAVSGGVLVEGPFYGINDFVVNNANIEWEDYMEINVERLDNSLNTVGTWQVAQAQPWDILAHMRHFAAHPSSYYELDFPTISPVHDVAVSVENMLTADDTLILGVEFSGSYDVAALYSTTWYSYMDLNHGVYRNDYSPVANFAALLASPGETYWQDAANNRVWVKLVGGVAQPWNPNDYPPTADEVLYRLFHLRLFGELSLPVELVNFTAKPNEHKGVDLAWTTASESNNARFTVERSPDGKGWGAIAQVAGKGNSGVVQPYFSVDKNPLPGMNYYRLAQVDFDGKTSHSPVVSVEVSGALPPHIFPNPNDGQFSIRLPDGWDEPLHARLLDAQGRVVWETILSGESPLVSLEKKLPVGVYALHFISRQKNWVEEVVVR